MAVLRSFLVAFTDGPLLYLSTASCLLQIFTSLLLDFLFAGCYYHNKKFKETAEAHGLAISHHPRYGWTVTDLVPDTAALIAQQPELSDITANRQATIQIKAKGNDEGDEDGAATTTTKGGRSTSKNRSIKYVCPKCGAIIRATKLVNVVCGDCNVAFEIAK